MPVRVKKTRQNKQGIRPFRQASRIAQDECDQWDKVEFAARRVRLMFPADLYRLLRFRLAGSAGCAGGAS
jgi:hypothetical protein